MKPKVQEGSRSDHRSRHDPAQRWIGAEADPFRSRR